MAADRPLDLSVVVALISGKVEHLRACLEALHTQRDAPALEILVPYDAVVAEVTQWQSAFPTVQFILAEGLDTAEARRGASREHHDRLRAIGIGHARGRIVALTEDHATVCDTWCRQLVDLLDARPSAAALGGAVECGSDRLLNWAVYYCDFGRYQNPVPEGPARYVSDSNVAYRREVLDDLRSVWQPDYHETLVHQAIAARGSELWLTPKVVVWQSRGVLRLRAALRERFVWGQSFAGARVSGAGLASRLAYAAVSSLLPFLLTYRLACGVLARKRLQSKFVQAAPLVFVLNSAWALGELVGYLRGRPK